MYSQLGFLEITFLLNKLYLLFIWYILIKLLIGYINKIR